MSKQTDTTDNNPATVGTKQRNDNPLEQCDKAHDAEQTRTSDIDEACFDSVR